MKTATLAATFKLFIRGLQKSPFFCLQESQGVSIKVLEYLNKGLATP